MRDVFVVTCMALVLTQVAVDGQQSMGLDRLTVPADQLVPGCRLTQSDTARLGSSQVRAGLWAGLPISINPWSGIDRSIVATLRERVVDPRPLPHGPFVSRSELDRIRLELASDVEQAYAAIYADSGPYLITVHAVTFNDATDLATLLPPGVRGGRVLIPNQTIALLSGVGPCFEVVAGHVKALATP